MAKIILVEDDATMFSLLQTLLQMEGFQVIPMRGESLEDFLKLMRAEKPALALVDVNLRMFNGMDLLRKIRSDPELRDTQVVMSSGMDYREQCLQAGANDFILKPYMPDDLISRIRSHI